MMRMLKITNLVDGQLTAIIQYTTCDVKKFYLSYLRSIIEEGASFGMTLFYHSSVSTSPLL